MKPHGRDALEGEGKPSPLFFLHRSFHLFATADTLIHGYESVIQVSASDQILLGHIATCQRIDNTHLILEHIAGSAFSSGGKDSRIAFMQSILASYIIPQHYYSAFRTHTCDAPSVMFDGIAVEDFAGMPQTGKQSVGIFGSVRYGALVMKKEHVLIVRQPVEEIAGTVEAAYPIPRTVDELRNKSHDCPAFRVLLLGEEPGELLCKQSAVAG